MNEEEITKCLTTDPKLSNLSDITDIKKLLFLLDQTVSLNFYNYLFLRRIDKALEKCGDNSILPPVNNFKIIFQKLF